MMRVAGLGFGFFGVLIYLGILGLSIYLMVLCIKLATRGIKALDIYIEKNRYDRGNYDPDK